MKTDNLRAIVLMVGAMAAFAVEDLLVKTIAGTMPTPQIIFVLSLGGAILFALVCARRGTPMVSDAMRHPYVIVRSLAEVGATLCYVSSLMLIPLSLASAILQATPIFVTMGAALWLGEPVGWRRWSAVLAGLLGVLVILRPGFEGFVPSALLAVAGSVQLAIRDVVSRRIPHSVRSEQLSLWAYGLLAAAAGFMGLASGGATGAPGWAWAVLALAVVVGAVAYMLLTTATRLGDVTTVIPFRYSRLIFALVLGIVLLGERPDAATLAGAAIVVASGLYAWLRERRRARALSTARARA